MRYAHDGERAKLHHLIREVDDRHTVVPKQPRSEGVRELDSVLWHVGVSSVYEGGCQVVRWRSRGATSDAVYHNRR